MPTPAQLPPLFPSRSRSPSIQQIYVDIGGGHWLGYISNAFLSDFTAALKQDLLRTLVLVPSNVNVSSYDPLTSRMTVQCYTVMSLDNLGSKITGTTWVNATAVFAAVSGSSAAIVTVGFTSLAHGGLSFLGTTMRPALRSSTTS